MRCPKCSYLSYDDVERCRNCGYDFALAAPAREPEPPVQAEPPGEPRTWEPSRRRRPGVLDTTAPAEGAALDLPLFVEPAVPEPPPVVIPPAGPPLSVRRTYDSPRPAPVAEPSSGSVTRDDSPAFEWTDATKATDDAPAGPDAVVAAPQADPIGPRVRAGLIDAALLLAIDAVVVWLTLRVAGVTLAEWALLPAVPLAGFLFLLDTAYLVTFTAASGQTIGKMVSGVRVVYGEQGRVPFGHAVLRSVAVLVCAIPFGLGLLPLFLDPGRRGAHDRLAGTRVVPSA